MTEVRIEPRFIPDTEAAPEVTEAFTALVNLIVEQPDEALPVLGHKSHGEVEQAAANLKPEDQSTAARVTRVLAHIFRENMDLDVDYDAQTANALSGKRNSVSQQGVRMMRIGTFAQRLAAWHAQTADAPPLSEVA